MKEERGRKAEEEEDEEEGQKQGGVMAVDLRALRENIVAGSKEGQSPNRV